MGNVIKLSSFILDGFDEIKNWISDERTHATWYAGLLKYPIEKENFYNVILEKAIKFGDNSYVATTDEGKLVGFFCYSVNLSTNESMLKFVTLAPLQCGKVL